MTPLKPIENIEEVRGVAATKYKTNEVCANPTCTKPGESDHHIFGRPPGKDSSSYFVVLKKTQKVPTPAVVRLCGDGTSKCHGDVEDHRAWIKYEDGEFVWYKLKHHWLDDPLNKWERVGPLNPQPGFNEGKPKRAKFRGEKRRKRKVMSIKVPQDEQEDGGAVLDELLGDGKGDVPYGRVRAKLDELGADGKRPTYYVLVDALNDWCSTP